jgi:NADPH-dependent curcumin reductase CurA
MTGCTAHGGLLEVLRPKRDETLFISAASGAVGALVGMLAKQLFNCKVIGSCGTDEKCRLVKEKYGFDHAINYKTVSDKDALIAALKDVAPEGIDMYFENVGGYHFEAAYESLRPKGRIAICGIISQYNDATVPKYEFDPVKAIYQQQRIEGFLCFDWLYQGTFVKEMGEFLKEGKIHSQETFFHGIEQWPAGFLSLFTGENVGKVVIKV